MQHNKQNINVGSKPRDSTPNCCYISPLTVVTKIQMHICRKIHFESDQPQTRDPWYWSCPTHWSFVIRFSQSIRCERREKIMSVSSTAFLIRTDRMGGNQSSFMFHRTLIYYAIKILFRKTYFTTQPLFYLLSLCVVILNEVLKQFNALLGFNFIYFDQVLKKT